jgi:cytosine/adenosine deaminase-related metal-dependent hydrolase
MCHFLASLSGTIQSHNPIAQLLNRSIQSPIAQFLNRQMTTVYRAAWVCPIAQPPIRNGWFSVRDGHIVQVAAPGERPPGAPARDLGRVAVLPGVVNAHTHLELSGLRDSVPPAAELTEWVRQLIAARGARRERADDEEMRKAAAEGCREAREMGTALIGDISNSLASVEPLRDHGLRGLVFHELIGFNVSHGRRVDDTRDARAAAAERGGDVVRVSIAPHAPYSVAPELFRAIRRAVNESAVPITSVHLAESEAECQFLESGSGPWPAVLKFVGSWRDEWVPPGCAPVDYLDRLGMLDSRTLVVHGVRLDERALARLAEIGCTLVTCPRSNQWVGAGVPPVARFYASGVRVAVGTDSLASVQDLNVFSELKTMRWLAPDVPARTLLASATIVGAEALGFGDELGSIEPGKRAELIAVELPPELVGERAKEGGTLVPPEAVEEFLVGGIDPRQIRWVTE